MGAREELLAAARSLGDRGLTAFSPAQLIAEARSLGTTYQDTTLRTFINGPMCVNSPDHHAVQYGDLERIARGLYRLVSGPQGIADTPTEDLEVLIGEAPEPPTAHDDEWFWEGNVQASGLVMRSEAADTRVVLAFPDVPTFNNLAVRVAGPLWAAGIEVWLVGPDATVTGVATR